MEVGLFFGSFNPIHTGHMIIASLVKETTSVKEVWFIVSPQNPFKKNKQLLHEFDRLDLVQSAINDDFGFRVSDIEFNMPRPSYTVDTLTLIQEKNKDKKFRLIIGGDNIESFQKWKNYDQILEHHGLIVYPRPSMKKNEILDHHNVQMIEAPEMDISATQIRKLLKQGKSIKYLVPRSVEERIGAKGFYT